VTTEQYLKYIRQSIGMIRTSKTYGEASHNIGRARGQIEILFSSLLLSSEDFATLSQETSEASEWARHELKGGYL